MNFIDNFTSVIRREMGFFGRHKTFFLLALGLPLVSFLYFGLLFKSGVPHNMPIAVLDEDNTTLSRKVTRMIDATPSAMVSYKISNLGEGEAMMKRGEVDAIVHISKGLERDIYSNTQADVLVYVNGLNLTKNGLLSKDIQTALITFSSGIQIQTLIKKGLSEAEAYEQVMPIYYEKHILFNPFINYGYYLLPAFLPLMLVLFVLLSTIFTIGVELKNGTAREWVDLAGGNIWVALMGKLLPYTVIFFILYLLMNTFLFQWLGVPLQGSVPLLFGSGAVMIVTYQAIGIFFIALLSNMRLSLSIGGGYSVLAFTFSGLTFPFMAMDPILRAIGQCFPLTHYIEIFIDQAMRGAPVANSLPYLGYLLLFLLLIPIAVPRLQHVCTEERFWGRL